MKKTILITGSTDGIGLETMKMLVDYGHKLFVHGRNHEKVDRVIKTLKSLNASVEVDGFVADLSDLDEVRKLATEITSKVEHLDVLINNAGVFVVKGDTITEDGFDVRFMVNAIAPYLLTKLLLPIMDETSRVVNLSSAAQTSVDIDKLLNGVPMQHGDAYAQSKLAITMWTNELAVYEKPLFVSVNPKSYLGSNMVKEGYGIEGHDIRIGADILLRTALSEEFNNANGTYFDNDYGVFSDPHPDAMNPDLRKELIKALESVI